MDKIHRPCQIVVQRLKQGLLNSQGKTPFVLSAKVQFHLCVDSVDSFVVVLEIERAQSVVHHPETPTAMQFSHLPQLCSNGFILLGLGFVANNGRRGANQFAGLAKTDCIALTSIANRLPLLARP